MSITISIWLFIVIIIVAILIGFYAGKMTYDNRDEKKEEKLEQNLSKEKVEENKEDNIKWEKLDLLKEWMIGSPISGEISSFYDEGRKGVVIHPEQGKLFAPVAGKVTKLYPTGNALQLSTDYGIIIMIQVGTKTDEWEGLYFRPRVVQNEIVVRGKLLLEFDIEGICKEGYDVSIRMSIEDSTNREVTIVDAARIKVGEHVLGVSK